MISLQLTAEAHERLVTKVKAKKGYYIICFYQMIGDRLVCWWIIVEDDADYED